MAEGYALPWGGSTDSKEEADVALFYALRDELPPSVESHAQAQLRMQTQAHAAAAQAARAAARAQAQEEAARAQPAAQQARAAAAQQAHMAAAAEAVNAHKAAEAAVKKAAHGAEDAAGTKNLAAEGIEEQPPVVEREPAAVAGGVAKNPGGRPRGQAAHGLIPWDAVSQHLEAMARQVTGGREGWLDAFRSNADVKVRGAVMAVVNAEGSAALGLLRAVLNSKGVASRANDKFAAKHIKKIAEKRRGGEPPAAEKEQEVEGEKKAAIEENDDELAAEKEPIAVGREAAVEKDPLAAEKNPPAAETKHKEAPPSGATPPAAKRVRRAKEEAAVAAAVPDSLAEKEAMQEGVASVNTPALPTLR